MVLHWGAPAVSLRMAKTIVVVTVLHNRLRFHSLVSPRRPLRAALSPLRLTLSHDQPPR